MSWNKNTTSTSKIDAVTWVLDFLGIPYELDILGHVIGLGLNDDYENNKTYPIRRLEIKNKVILEQMVRNNDCDTDDVIVSYIFDKEDEPEDWDLEIGLDVYED